MRCVRLINAELAGAESGLVESKSVCLAGHLRFSWQRFARGAC